MVRKHLGWYVRGLPGSAEFRGRVNGIGEADEVERALVQFFDPLIARGALRAAEPEELAA